MTTKLTLQYRNVTVEISPDSNDYGPAFTVVNQVTGETFTGFLDLFHLEPRPDREGCLQVVLDLPDNQAHHTRIWGQGRVETFVE